MSVRGALEWDVLDGVLHRQKAVPGLLDADVLPFFGTKVIISEQDKLFVHQTQGSATSRKLLKVGDGHRTFLRKDFHLSLLADKKCCCGLTHKGGGIERFILPVDTCDDRGSLSNVTGVTFKSALKSRIGLGLIVQEGGANNGHLLGLAMP